MKTIITSIIPILFIIMFCLGVMCCFITAEQEDRRLEKENEENKTDAE